MLPLNKKNRFKILHANIPKLKVAHLPLLTYTDNICLYFKGTQFIDLVLEESFSYIFFVWQTAEYRNGVQNAKPETLQYTGLSYRSVQAFKYINICMLYHTNLAHNFVLVFSNLGKYSII